MVRNLVGAASIVLLAIGTAAGFGACSKEEASQKPPAVETPSTVPVVSATWGSADGQLGHDIPEQGLPQGPKTLVVDASGGMHVLDIANQRIQNFIGGMGAGSIKIPDRPFEDLELDGSGGFVLLDMYDQAALVFIGADGTQKSEVPLASLEIPEPSLTTALVRGPDGFYVEIESDYLVRVADLQGGPVEQEVVPGQVLDEKLAFKVESDEPNLLSLSRMELPDGEIEELSDLDMHQRVAERTLFTEAPNLGLLLAVRLESDQSDPEQPPTELHRLFVVDTDGNVKKKLVLPNAGSAENIYRPVRFGEDGSVYVMTVSDTGVEIGKVTP